MSSPTDSGSDSSTRSPTNSTPHASSGSPSTRGTCLDVALDRLRTERRILSDERSAFQAFADRLLDSEAPLPTETVESHYCETVMAVPHYDSEYDDTFAESVAAECSLALAVACQRRTRLEADVVAEVREAVTRCRDRRDRLVDRIDAERHAIARADDELEAILHDLKTLEDGGDGDRSVRLHLARLRERCDAVERRREQLQSDPVADDPELEIEAGALQSLCYRELETNRPVFVAVESVRNTIEARRRDAVDRRSERH